MACQPRVLLLAASLLSTAGAVTAADRPTIASEGPLAAWRPVAEQVTARPMPGYPGRLADKSADVCVSIGYLIGQDGSTTNYALLKSWSSADQGKKANPDLVTPFAQNSIAAVQQWRFTPGEGFARKPQPVYTAATFAFAGDQPGDKSQVREHCAINDLPEFIANVQAEAYKRGNLKKSEIDRNQVQNPPAPPPIRGP